MSLIPHGMKYGGNHAVCVPGNIRTAGAIFGERVRIDVPHRHDVIRPGDGAVNLVPNFCRLSRHPYQSPPAG